MRFLNGCIQIFRHIHSFIPDISIYHLLKSTTTQKHSRLQHWYCVRVNMPKCYRQLWVKDLPKVPTWQLEWDLNLQPSGRNLSNLQLSHHAPRTHMHLECFWVLTLKRGYIKLCMNERMNKIHSCVRFCLLLSLLICTSVCCLSIVLRDDLGFRVVCEQVSHHPPVSALHAESSYFTFSNSVQPKLKFWGKSVEVQPIGKSILYLQRYASITKSYSVGVIVWQRLLNFAVPCNLLCWCFLKTKWLEGLFACFELWAFTPIH